jgi:CDP-diglyceride synthetase
MCCCCIILSRTRSYGPVYSMSVWCLKWTLWWRVRAPPLVQYCPCATILQWWVTHWHLHYSYYSFIHLVTHSFYPVFNWAYLTWPCKRITFSTTYMRSNRLSPGVSSHFSTGIHIYILPWEAVKIDIVYRK